MPVAALGSGFLVLLRASSRMKVGNGRMQCGQICVPNVESNYLFKGLARTTWILEPRSVSARKIYN